MFKKGKQKDRGGEWSGEEEQNEGREDQDIVFTFFSITISITKRYFRFSHLFMYFFCKFTISFVKSRLNHRNYILSDICGIILKSIA